jgi:hypothetical protein
MTGFPPRDDARGRASAAEAAVLFLARGARIAAILSLTAGCSSRQTPRPVALDCAAAEAPFDQEILETYEQGPNYYGWYAYGDTTPGATMTGQDGGPLAASIPEDGGRCGSMSALFLQAQGFHDYGCGWGTYSIGGYAGPQSREADGAPCVYPDGDSGICPLDESAWQGLRFWARSFDPTGAPTTKGVTVTINDKETFAAVGSTCVDYDAGNLANGAVVYTVPAGGTAGPAGGGVTSAVPPANACGNGFAYPLTTTDEWQLYTIPFSAFDQLARPSRAATGFESSSFLQIIIAAPKEAQLALWVDDVGFYRARQADAGVEAGP